MGDLSETSGTELSEHHALLLLEYLGDEASVIGSTCDFISKSFEQSSCLV